MLTPMTPMEKSFVLNPSESSAADSTTFHPSPVFLLAVLTRNVTTPKMNSEIQHSVLTAVLTRSAFLAVFFAFFVEFLD